MNGKKVLVGVALAVVAAAFLYRFTHLKGAGSEAPAAREAAHGEEKTSGHDKEEHHGEKAEKHADDGEHDGHGEAGGVTMAADLQKQHGVVTAPARMQRLGGTISATGKVSVNEDRIAHVSPRIPGKIVAVKAALGDSVAAGQTLATLDSVELGEAVNRYRQSATRLKLARNNLERVTALLNKKIIARKEVFQAESDYQSALADHQTDEERLVLYGLPRSGLKGATSTALLPLGAPISGVVTQKAAVPGELADPSRSIYTIADLSSLWVLVDINERDLAKVRTGQAAIVTVGAFPGLKLNGRITHMADLVDEATRTVKARVEVRNPDRKLKPEMFATVELVLPADTPAVLAVPDEALQELESGKVVFVTENGTEFEPRRVAVGRSSGGMTELVSGLKEGERYVVKGSFLIKFEMQKGELGEHGH